jgi:hypothetical protein
MKLERKHTNPSLIRKIGIEALSKALGPVGMARFLQQYETGIGDYTKERTLWLKDKDIKSVADEVRRKRKKRRL